MVAPGLEPLLTRGKRPDTSGKPVGDDEGLVHGEQRGEFGFVRLELLPCRPNVGLLVNRVLQLDNGQGRPLTKSTTSGRRWFWFSVTVNWLTASQSLADQLSKSMTWACSPRMAPSPDRYSTLTPFSNMRWKARLRTSSVAPSGCVSLRRASSKADAGTQDEPGYRPPQPPFQNYLAVVISFRTGRFPGRCRARAPPATQQFPSHSRAAASTVDSVRVVISISVQQSKHGKNQKCTKCQMHQGEGQGDPLLNVGHCSIGLPLHLFSQLPLILVYSCGKVVLQLVDNLKLYLVQVGVRLDD